MIPGFSDVCFVSISIATQELYLVKNGFKFASTYGQTLLVILAIVPHGATTTIEKSIKIYRHMFVWHFFNANFCACITQELFSQLLWNNAKMIANK